MAIGLNAQTDCTMTRLHIDVAIRFPEFELKVAFNQAIRVLAVTGRSGIGKTSLLNAMAGLIRPTAGHIAVDDDILFDRQRGLFVPIHKRRIGFVFQDMRLFPHLNVAHNLDYAEFLARRRKALVRRDQLIELLGINQLLDRHPHHLSGGEKQRVAIARAMLTAPRLILLDEPVSAVDRSRRLLILKMLQDLKTEIEVPMVLVSHNKDDIATLADSNLDLEDGHN